MTCYFQKKYYDQHAASLNSCPYLNAYMLGYSKMLMQCSFQFLAEIGAVPCMTDTDSIIFKATEEMYKQYAELFIPVEKTFGRVEPEGEGTELPNTGPKKYALKEANGNYVWHHAGVRAKANVHLDIWDKMLSVLEGNVEEVNHFTIQAGRDLCVFHSLLGLT